MMIHVENTGECPVVVEMWPLMPGGMELGPHETRDFVLPNAGTQIDIRLRAKESPVDEQVWQRREVAPEPECCSECGTPIIQE